jgi:putative transposase
MPFDPSRHHRRSIRLRGYDYSEAGAYFVTICSRERECLFGQITDGAVVWTPFGEGVVATWEAMPTRFPTVDLDAWVLMPNHLHGILVLNDPTANVTAANTAPLPSQRPFLGGVIAWFKYLSTKEINRLRGTPGQRVWQRNYHEHIIRNERSLEELRNYTVENPLRWELDRLHPDQPPWQG